MKSKIDGSSSDVLLVFNDGTSLRRSATMEKWAKLVQKVVVLERRRDW